MDLESIISRIEPIDCFSAKKAQKRLDSIAKPLKSLGVFEDIIVNLAGIQRTEKISIYNKYLAVMCADNGVVSQNVTQCGQEVTAVVTRNMAKGSTSACCMAKKIGVGVVTVDVGVNADFDKDGNIINKKIDYGTKDITKYPAMTYEQALKSIYAGIETAFILNERAADIIITGEMGIGNTTTTAAVASVMLDMPPEKVTGRGAGLSSEYFKNKIEAVKRAIYINSPNKNDAIDVLRCVGGFDIGALCGLCLGGAYLKKAVFLDGSISLASALLAIKICPQVIDYIIPTHMPSEPAGVEILNFINKKPFIYGRLSLGEGSGALIGVSAVDTAISVYNDMATFDDISIEPYKPLH